MGEGHQGAVFEVRKHPNKVMKDSKLLHERA